MSRFIRQLVTCNWQQAGVVSVRHETKVQAILVALIESATLYLVYVIRRLCRRINPSFSTARPLNAGKSDGERRILFHSFN